VEGQFYRTTKTDKHPHTNMAKAALNMMTRTSAPDFVKDGIHMNAVDTGWVTDEDPAAHAARKAELGFSPPQDIIDGALVASVGDRVIAFLRRCNGIEVGMQHGARQCPHHDESDGHAKALGQFKMRESNCRCQTTENQTKNFVRLDGMNVRTKAAR
jgi:hypothetical protein